MVVVFWFSLWKRNNYRSLLRVWIVGRKVHFQWKKSGGSADVVDKPTHQRILDFPAASIFWRCVQSHHKKIAPTILERNRKDEQVSKWQACMDQWERRRQNSQQAEGTATAPRTCAGAIRTHSGDTALLEFMSCRPCRMMILLVGIASDEGAKECRLWITSDALFCRHRHMSKENRQFLLKRLICGVQRTLHRGEPGVRGCGWTEGHERTEGGIKSEALTSVYLGHESTFPLIWHHKAEAGNLGNG